MVRVKVVWNLTKPLPDLRMNEETVVKPVEKSQLAEVGKILVITWGGFIKNPETTVKWVGPKVEAKLEQPFIAYLKGKPVGTACPLLDRESKSGRLDGGVHVLPKYRRQRIGTTLLMTALKWLKNNGMKEAWVTPWNPEGETATQRAISFYLSNGGTISER
ncbi:MAG: GNAT family N-acetyltransferase [Candidatus Bathyarchaeota archaeon]|nr:GNAT family N-acetyltransferase [Candidatus Bathyarchaeota archaeon]MDH5495680.1 GNAT family N-acetyltransferase [Candidatus Bathyarchaeota archaeon]